MGWIKKTLLVVAILLLTAVLALFTAPARLLTNRLMQQNPGLVFDQVSGSLWRGSAQSVRARGIAIGALNWKLNPLSLLSLQPEVAVQLSDKGLKIATTVQRALSGAIKLQALTAQADAAWLAPALAIPLLKPTGELRAQISELIVDAKGVPQRALGTVRWENAGVSGLAQANFGGVQIELKAPSAPTTNIEGLVTPLGDNPALEVTGGFQLTGKSYQAEVRLQPNGENAQVSRALQFVGEPAPGADLASGARLLKIQGELLL